MYELQRHPDPSVSAASPAAAPANLGAIISRLAEAVEEETIQIRKDVTFDIRAANLRKSRYLYELSKALKGVTTQDLSPEHRSAMLGLREKLVVNEQVLRAHMDAVGEVAELVRDAMQKADNDGTYSEGAFTRKTG